MEDNSDEGQQTNIFSTNRETVIQNLFQEQSQTDDQLLACLQHILQDPAVSSEDVTSWLCFEGSIFLNSTVLLTQSRTASNQIVQCC